MRRASEAVGPFRDMRGEDRFGASGRAVPGAPSSRESPRPGRAQGLAGRDRRHEQIVRGAEQRYDRSVSQGAAGSAHPFATAQPWSAPVEVVRHMMRTSTPLPAVDHFSERHDERVEDDSRDGPDDHAELYDPDNVLPPGSYRADPRGYEGDPLTIGRGSPAPQGGGTRDDLETEPGVLGNPSAINVKFVYNQIKRTTYELLRGELQTSGDAPSVYLVVRRGEER